MGLSIYEKKRGDINGAKRRLHMYGLWWHWGLAAAIRYHGGRKFLAPLETDYGKKLPPTVDERPERVRRWASAIHPGLNLLLQLTNNNDYGDNYSIISPAEARVMADYMNGIPYRELVKHGEPVHVQEFYRVRSVLRCAALHGNRVEVV